MAVVFSSLLLQYPFQYQKAESRPFSPFVHLFPSKTDGFSVNPMIFAMNAL
jgi:hypothetical protein